MDDMSQWRTREKVEAAAFLAGCLLVLLACNGAGGANRSAESPGQADPRLAMCEHGDSGTCNQVGEELWEEQAYSEARDWFAIACARMNDVPANGQRIVELNAKARAEPQTIESLQPESDELRARIEGCLRAGDTYHMEGNHAAAQPYFAAVCRLMPIEPQASPLIPDFKVLVGSACDGSQYSRQQAVADAASRAQVRGVLLATPAASAVPTASPAAAASSPPGRCLDYGKICDGDPAVVEWQEQCDSNPWTKAPCYCAATATFKCFIAQGCYAEAGAQRPDGQPSDHHLSSLQAGAEQNAAAAQKLGTYCP